MVPSVSNTPTFFKIIFRPKFTNTTVVQLYSRGIGEKQNNFFSEIKIIAELIPMQRFSGDTALLFEGLEILLKGTFKIY